MSFIDYKKLNKEIDRGMVWDTVKFYAIVTVCVVGLGASIFALVILVAGT